MDKSQGKARGQHGWLGRSLIPSRTVKVVLAFKRGRAIERTLRKFLMLWLVCLYHVFMGVGAFLSKDMVVWLADVFFGIKLQVTPQISYLAKLLGIYVVAFGLMVAVAALDPARHPSLLKIVIILYGLRVLNKLVFADLYTAAFAAPRYRAWVDIAMLAAFGGPSSCSSHGFPWGIRPRVLQSA